MALTFLISLSHIPKMQSFTFWKFFGLGISANGYGPEDYWKNLTHTRSIKWRYLTSFSIKRLYTRPDVAKFTIYHKAHTRIDGLFTHGEHDSKSISRMSHYAPCMSQALKDHIWAQLSLGYMTKQIYNKHKTIW